MYLEKPMTYTIPEAAKLATLSRTPSACCRWAARVRARGFTGRSMNTSPPARWASGLGTDQLQPEYAGGDVGYPIPGVGSDHWPDAKVTPAKISIGRCGWVRHRSANIVMSAISGGASFGITPEECDRSAVSPARNDEHHDRLRLPHASCGAGGIYVQKNREVPDTYMTMIEYPGDYAMNMVSCMANHSPCP